MKWKTIRKRREQRNLETWHQAFAWFPHKTVDEVWVWLEAAERRFIWTPGIGWEDFGGWHAEWRLL